MSQTTDLPGAPDGAAPPDAPPASDRAPSDGPSLLSRVPRLGVWAWSFVGVIVAVAILLAGVAAVSEVILPFTFAAVLAICFKPAAGWLGRKGMKPAGAAGLIVLLLLGLTTVVAVATFQGVVDQTAEIGQSVDAAIDKAAAELEVDKEDLQAARNDVESAEPMVTGGFLTEVVGGFNALVALAGGLILGALIMYYLLKDGTKLRRTLVDGVDPSMQADVDGFFGDACRILRDYGRGRTAMSAIVSLVVGLVALLLGLPLILTIIVVNFIGGYIPYIGAFLGGGLAVIVAFGEGGIETAAIMLLAVLAANLLLENFVEPRVMGRTLDIHPLVVLVVTAVGGIVGGIVGLILAVPAWVVATSAIARLRRAGFFSRVARQAEPTVRRMLQ